MPLYHGIIIFFNCQLIQPLEQLKTFPRKIPNIPNPFLSPPKNNLNDLNFYEKKNVCIAKEIGV